MRRSRRVPSEPAKFPREAPAQTMQKMVRGPGSKSSKGMIFLSSLKQHCLFGMVFTRAIIATQWRLARQSLGCMFTPALRDASWKMTMVFTCWWGIVFCLWIVWTSWAHPGFWSLVQARGLRDQALRGRCRQASQRTGNMEPLWRPLQCLGWSVPARWCCG